MEGQYAYEQLTALVAVFTLLANKGFRKED